MDEDQPAPETAGFGRRLTATVVDLVLAALVAALFTRPHPPGSSWSTAAWVIAHTLFVGFFSETPGMRLLGLRCRTPDGQAPGILRALLRAVLIALVVPVLLTDATGQRWHDRLAGTTVLRVPRRPRNAPPITRS
jgi:uncharacterized RDD family membrane protein YckC